MPRLRIHHRLFAGFLGVVLISAALTLLLVGKGLKKDLTATFEEDLTRQLALAAELLHTHPRDSADTVARLITRLVGYRVTLIAADGFVLGDSYVSRGGLANMENHGDRPEVLGATREGTSFAVRTSETVGVSLLYAARRVDWAGEPVVLRMAAPLTDVEDAVAGAYGTVAVTGIVASLAALLMAFFLSKALARPLVVMADQARRITAGDFTQRARHAVRIAELDDLAVAFNRLTDELQVRLRELGGERDEMQTLIDCMAEGVVAVTEDSRIVRMNRAARTILGVGDAPVFAPVGTMVRNQEVRGLLESSLRSPVQAMEVRVGPRTLLFSSRSLDRGGAVSTLLDITEIRRLEQVRRDFVANASHEFKTPLTSIRGFAETLLESEPPDQLRREFLAAIGKNTLRLQHLVDDLLDLSRLESGGWVARPERIRVADAAEEAWEQVAASAVARRVELVLDADVEVNADHQALVNVFRNLFENAVRHTDPGGHVRVSVGNRSGDPVEVRVSDDGEGIPIHVLPRIFERFYRGDSARAREVGGTGLGLAIVRHLVQAVGGEIRVESELGRGTTFRLTLPAVAEIAPGPS
ncbi:MAG: ATP-binding protein [Gemmatimonadota bacterium]|nr:ATP-binding protein [Gemmatimonadota bacterium]MDH5758729.1 ATP-binding protein [Gemmatimonadota bacterium]